jgi:pyruvate formate lyase activating enzyme
MVPIDSEDEGLIFNIQRFSIHDGPGIRTTIFMKGCPLRCEWCSNPESQDSFPNLMVRDILCRACGQCVLSCPLGAITISEKGRKIDRRKCDQCLKCVKSCIYQSLSGCGKYMKLGEVLTEVLRDKAFYKNSGGGITVSGGEPLLQGKFVANLLDLCKKDGVHTVLDTAGYASWETTSKVLQFSDLVLFDIKHLDSGKHKKMTGVENDLIIENFVKVSKCAGIWLRIPLIAGFNDSEKHIKRIALLGKENGVKKISLLPYHEGGKTKCEHLGRPYLFSGGETPRDEHIMRLRETIEREGMKVSIGN